MQHKHNARADRYPVRRRAVTDGPHTSREITPFCQIDDDGVCEQEWHVHSGPVRTPLWARWRKVYASG